MHDSGNSLAMDARSLPAPGQVSDLMVHALERADLQDWAARWDIASART